MLIMTLSFEFCLEVSLASDLHISIDVDRIRQAWSGRCPIPLMDDLLTV